DALRGFRVALRPQAERRRLAAGAPGYPALDHPPQPVLRRRMIAHELGMRLLAHSEPAVEQRIDQVLPVLEVPVEAAFGDAEPACQRLDAHALDPRLPQCLPGRLDPVVPALTHVSPLPRGTSRIDVLGA